MMYLDGGTICCCNSLVGHIKSDSGHKSSGQIELFQVPPTKCNANRSIKQKLLLHHTSGQLKTNLECTKLIELLITAADVAAVLRPVVVVMLYERGSRRRWAQPKPSKQCLNLNEIWIVAIMLNQ